jgi:hypothetical protein
MSIAKISLFLFCLSISPPTFALRCGHELVDIGDNKNDVLDKCGDPESVDSHIERRGASNYANARIGDGQYNRGNSLGYGQQHYIEIDVLVEEWVYDFGRRRLQQYLRFENGRLKEIKTMGRGD